MHSNDLVHRKLNLDTVLVQKNKNPVIIGFGNAIDEKRGIDLGRGSGVGNVDSISESTSEYIAPELFHKEGKSSSASDMWAFGTHSISPFFSNFLISTKKKTIFSFRLHAV